MQKTLKITLISDLCAASGDGFASVVDTDVCFDKFGLPYIPAKRVKGCLRECALEIVDVEFDLADEYEMLFGRTGEKTSCELKLGNGRLENYDALAAEAIKYSPDEVLSCFTYIRSRTKIEDGCSADETLRTARVIKSGTVFLFDCELSEKSITLFKRSLKLFRNMGLNRTRGLGEIKCEMIDDIGKTYALNLKIDDYGKDKLLSYTIYLDEPVISADRCGKNLGCEDYIFGTTMQGAIANLWLKANNRPENVYENPEFRQLFLNGDVIFTAMFPTDENKTYYYAPNTLKTDKLKRKLFDESQRPCLESDENPICQKLGGFAYIDGNKIHTISISKETSMHHSRPVDKRIAHANESDGKLFSYEAISRGQKYSGAVIGSENNIIIIKKLLEANTTLHLGRSVTAQFGKTKVINISGLAADAFKTEYTVKPGEMFRLVVRTPLIICDDYGCDTLDLSAIPKLLGFDCLEIVKSFCSQTQVAGYNSTWRLPRRQMNALAEGSVLIIENMGDKTLTLSKVFIGLRNDCGFGQISLEPLPDGYYEYTISEKPTSDTSGKTSNISYLEPLIQKHRNAKMAIAKGAEYATQHEKHNKNKPSNSQLSRLITVLNDDKINTFELFTNNILEIKQIKQRNHVLSLCLNKSEQYFDKHNINKQTIVELLSKSDNYNDYKSFSTFLTSVITELKHSRRKTESMGDNDGK